MDRQRQVRHNRAHGVVRGALTNTGTVGGVVCHSPEGAETDRVAATIAAYDAGAACYGDCLIGTDLSRHHDWLLGALPRSKAPVIDAGCGAGRDLRLLRQLGVPAIGVDLSAGMLAVAASNGPIPVVRGDIRVLPFADGTFSGAWCCAVVVHMQADGVAVALTELHRVLVDKAPMFLSLRTDGTDGWQDFAGGSRWYTHYSREQAENLLVDASFSVRTIVAEGDAAGRKSISWLAIHALAR